MIYYKPLKAKDTINIFINSITYFSKFISKSLARKFTNKIDYFLFKTAEEFNKYKYVRISPFFIGFLLQY